MPSLVDLSADMRASDRAYIDYVSGLDFDQLAEEIDFVLEALPEAVQRLRTA